MKQILSIILFSLFFSTSAFAQSKTEADTLYTKEKYEEAANMYEKILATQGEAAEIYYNLGNCYYKLDNVPYSILNYERALMLDPGDGDIRANLALARARTVDRVTPPSEMFFITWWHNITNSMSIAAWIRLAVISFILMLIGILAYMFHTNLKIRQIGAYGAILLFLLTIMANLCALTQHNYLANRSFAIMIAPATTVKSSPSESSTDLFIIHEGSKVEILDNTMKGWREVKLEEGKIGWVEVNSMEMI
jgi:tetratricopeptide (TPR) repeat protein